MKRLFDFVLAVVLLFFLVMPIILADRHPPAEVPDDDRGDRDQQQPDLAVPAEQQAGDKRSGG